MLYNVSTKVLVWWWISGRQKAEDVPRCGSAMHFKSIRALLQDDLKKDTLFQGYSADLPFIKTLKQGFCPSWFDLLQIKLLLFQSLAGSLPGRIEARMGLLIVSGSFQFPRERRMCSFHTVQIFHISFSGSGKSLDETHCYAPTGMFQRRRKVLWRSEGEHFQADYTRYQMSHRYGGSNLSQHQEKELATWLWRDFQEVNLAGLNRHTSFAQPGLLPTFVHAAIGDLKPPQLMGKSVRQSRKERKSKYSRILPL